MRAVALLSAAALVCCASLPNASPAPYQVDTGSSPLAYIVEFRPPPMYAVWWDQMRACSGVAQPVVPFRALRFYAVGRDSTFRTGTTEVYAIYDIQGRSILIAAPILMRKDIVRHEFLHVLTSPNRNVGHPDSTFRGRCDTLVYHADGATPPP